MDLHEGDLILLKTKEEMNKEFGEQYERLTGAVLEMDIHLGGIYMVQKLQPVDRFTLEGVHRVQSGFQWSWNINMVKAISRKLSVC